MTEKNATNLRVAVVGAGVAGVTAAHLLQRRHQMTLYEKNDYVGGHTHTIEVPDGPDRGLPVDTGFIVLNDRTYPLLHRLLAQLGVDVRDTEMSFSFQSGATGLEYACTGLNQLFAQRRNLVRPAHWRLLFEVARFCRTARADLAENRLGRATLHEYLARGRYHRDMVDHYLVPMASAIWSTPPGQVTSFPAEPFLRFFDNHGLLSPFHRPRWQTVVGGSHAYVKAFLAGFGGEVHTRAAVTGIRRGDNGVTVSAEGGEPESYDRAVVAAHADEELRLLDDPCDLERDLLGTWRYQRNRVVLHTDASFLPRSRRAWGCWNYSGGGDPGLAALGCVTYWMNALQGLRTANQYCVTLNPDRPVPQASTLRELEYSHPTFSLASMATQA
ncbi:MAG: FAD-dependent oxidoreductase [Deferrisomatales bacterium]|nr:FAD-dependent oxidoreductase [Deferrisomatales bacterium]